MKKLLFTLTLLALLGFLSGCAWLEKPTPDYRVLMLESAVRADTEAGRAAARARDAYLDENGSQELRIDFDELLLLSRCLTLRAGDERLSDEQRLCTGEVLLNRVASPEFPNSIEEVIFQPGQYAGVDCDAFRDLLDPDEASVEAALRLLQGDRLMEPQVVFQANFRQGGGEYLNFYSSAYGYTYFCLSSHPEYYI